LPLEERMRNLHNLGYYSGARRRHGPRYHFIHFDPQTVNMDFRCTPPHSMRAFADAGGAPRWNLVCQHALASRRILATTLA
jgi:hypothetical protein